MTNNLIFPPEREALVEKPYYRDNHGSGLDYDKPRVVRDLRDGVPDGPDVVREVLAVCTTNEHADKIVAALNAAALSNPVMSEGMAEASRQAVVALENAEAWIDELYIHFVNLSDWSKETSPRLGEIRKRRIALQAALSTTVPSSGISEGEMREILAVELERIAKEAFPYTQRELRDDAKLLRAGEIAGPRIRAALSAMSQALHRSR